ncbi:MAG: glucosaminidase domain-containing protein [Chromatiales bacterium]|nr:MAG: glucosaminidase domain-containing protein [Chromatiales bacterium]
MNPSRLAFFFAASALAIAGCGPDSTDEASAAKDTAAAAPHEVLVFGGVDAIVQWLQAERWWGEVTEEQIGNVPHVVITGIAPGWQTAAQDMPVPQKKEIFYRFMLPLALRANELVRERRGRLEQMVKDLDAGQALSDEQLEGLRIAARFLRIRDEETAAQLGGDAVELRAVIDTALYRLDEIPAGLVLGQAAYESGYGTSRFAVLGNALFGQWTYSGEGLVPQQQRKHLGDHRIASYDWPFDSVRSYFLNLSSHPAYEDLRALRAKLKREGKPVTSLALVDGLRRYSERGQAYVDTLKGIIRKNGLDRADNAAFRDEPMRFVVTADGEDAATGLRKEIEHMRAAGELGEIIARMRLE